MSKPHEDPTPALPPVKVVKRDDAPRSQQREKACATCGRTFVLEPGQKYFDCPDCYRKKHPPKAIRKGAARVLTQIQCSACGCTEFVSFVPEDSAAVLCRACYAARHREPKV